MAKYTEAQFRAAVADAYSAGFEAGRVGAGKLDILRRLIKFLGGRRWF